MRRYSDAASIAKALDGRPSGDRWVCKCPAHNDQKPSMSIAEKDGKILFHCHAGCSQENVIATLRSRGLWPKRGSVMEDRRVTIDENEGEREAKEKQFRHLVSLWRAMALTSQKPAKYLKGRGLDILPPCARLLSVTDSKRLTGYAFPAMAMPITDGELLRGAHVTFLTDDGAAKADTDTPRRMYGAAKGGWVQLGESDPDKPLIVGEGVESTLSAMQLAECPGIAAMSASLLTAVRPPPCREIIIAADNDQPGRKAAAALAERLRYEGRRVRIALPAKPRGCERAGYDWNDALQDRNAIQTWQAALAPAFLSSLRSPRKPRRAFNDRGCCCR